jgi:DNA-binding NarL/FixJ family response regulator
MKIKLTKEQIDEIIKVEKEKLTEKYEAELKALENKYEYFEIEIGQTNKFSEAVKKGRIKIDEGKLKLLLMEGKSKKEIADFFEKTEAAISTKMNQLKLKMSDFRKK